MSGVPSLSEASASAAGYYYQVRYALLRALETLRHFPTASVSIEKLEDVAIEYDGGMIDLDQLKHTLLLDKFYGDADPSIWRTLGNWIRAYPNAALTDGTIRLFLTTVGSAKPGSGISKLGPERDKEDVKAARKLLSDEATKSQNKATAADRQAFLSLPEPVQTAILSAVTFVENAPNLSSISSEIEDILHYVCESSALRDFRSDLEGWWFGRVMEAWKLGEGANVPLLELSARVDLLRERYKRSSLTIDVSEPEAIEPLDDRLFIMQIRALNVRENRVRNAQRDFLKAGSQRSKWIRKLEVDPAELDSYDNDLIERWNRESAILLDELCETSGEHDKCASGRKLLGWAETLELPIRNARAQFLTSGSYHSLADNLTIGWHPDFKTKFAK